MLTRLYCRTGSGTPVHSPAVKSQFRDVSLHISLGLALLIQRRWSRWMSWGVMLKGRWCRGCVCVCVCVCPCFGSIPAVENEDDDAAAVKGGTTCLKKVGATLAPRATFSNLLQKESFNAWF